jgi:hypothetical protein
MTVLGEHKIIINESDLINNETVLNLMVVLGSIVIHVPPNVNVINRSFPLLADISIANNVSERGCKKTIILTGNVMLGEIKVKVKKT